MKNVFSLFIFALFFLTCRNGAEDVPVWSTEAPDIHALEERNVFSVLVTSDGEILVRDEPQKISELIQLTKRFIANPEKEEGLAASPQRAIINLERERSTSNALYLEVYNALKQAYEELWDEMAQDFYGLPYSTDMPYEQRRAIKHAIPMFLSEQEPTNFNKE